MLPDYTRKWVLPFFSGIDILWGDKFQRKKWMYMIVRLLPTLLPSKAGGPRTQRNDKKVNNTQDIKPTLRDSYFASLALLH